MLAYADGIKQFQSSGRSLEAKRTVIWRGVTKNIDSGEYREESITTEYGVLEPVARAAFVARANSEFPPRRVDVLYIHNPLGATVHVK